MGIKFGLRSIVRLFKRGDVSVCGLRGCGKDLLSANVIVRRDKPYISNIDYGGKYIPLDFKDLDCGGNTYDNFINGDIKYYKFPHPLGTDIYLSDGGIYLPSQFCNELNKKYPYLSTYIAISRHVSRNNVHFNTQNLNRMWDKVREQSDTYITCNRCIYFFGLVFQRITIYERYDACVNRVRPCRVKIPLFNKGAKMQARLYIDNYENTHGLIRRHLLIYRNKSKYDTHHFKKLLEGGKKNDS